MAGWICFHSSKRHTNSLFSNSYLHDSNDGWGWDGMEWVDKDALHDCMRLEGCMN